jgi:hypothetical protein
MATRILTGIGAELVHALHTLYGEATTAFSEIAQPATVWFAPEDLSSQSVAMRRSRLGDQPYSSR